MANFNNHSFSRQNFPPAGGLISASNEAILNRLPDEIEDQVFNLIIESRPRSVQCPWFPFRALLPPLIYSLISNNAVRNKNIVETYVKLNRFFQTDIRTGNPRATFDAGPAADQALLGKVRRWEIEMHELISMYDDSPIGSQTEHTLLTDILRRLPDLRELTISYDLTDVERIKQPRGGFIALRPRFALRPMMEDLFEVRDNSNSDDIELDDVDSPESPPKGHTQNEFEQFLESRILPLLPNLRTIRLEMRIPVVSNDGIMRPSFGPGADNTMVNQLAGTWDVVNIPYPDPFIPARRSLQRPESEVAAELKERRAEEEEEEEEEEE